MSAANALDRVARSLNLDPTEARSLRDHASSVFLLPAEHLVARVRDDPAAVEVAERVVRITGWLAEHGVPVTVPADLSHPVAIDEFVITFWPYLPQHSPQPPIAALGAILRSLHHVPEPPERLPTYLPLDGFDTLVAASTALDAADQKWLLERHAHLVGAYDAFDSQLGFGLIHGDAYQGNLLWAGDTVVLGDWDDVAIGPRELDLANTYQSVRFGRSQADLDEFATAYGHDLKDSPGLEVLTSIRDLHTLTGFIRAADRGSQTAARELRLRVDTLRNADRRTRWTAH
ncbi:aminoglycoside phosphotransferase family protein [Nocardioides speluncae]|uniref:aminoglycoside phosphotransferase family protein n=1 Tax=Nocardioides speluncae TaxID=2670337 RepID=UPI000D68BD78|nr:aminoglycoside phosphotransferase family protein [Nocardioides speluncae]